MFYWQQAIEILERWVDTSTWEFLLQLLFILCSLLVVGHLFALWGTRWGNQNSLTKSLYLSLLIHVCLGWGWATIVPPTPPSVAALETSPVTIRQVKLQDLDTVRPSESSSGASGPWQQLLPSPERQATRIRRDSLPASEASLPEISASAVPQTPMLPPEETQLPTIDDVDVTPQTQAIEQTVSAAPTATPAMEETQAAEARTESRSGSFSRQSITRRPELLPPVNPQAIANNQPSRNSAVNSVTRADQRLLDAPPAGGFEPALPDIPPETMTSDRKFRTPSSATRGGVRSPVASPQPLPAAHTVLRGVVRDAKTGRPLGSTMVRVDLSNREPILTRTSEDGTYELFLNKTPENVAVSAALKGYLPESKNLRVGNNDGSLRQLDFSLSAMSETVIAVEENPEVHHLGNDRFEGPVNSRFQRPTEGESFTARIQVSAEQLSGTYPRAAITFLAKGIQCSPKVSVNGHVIPRELPPSSADGSFSASVLPISPTWLRVGENVIQIHAVVCNGDLDDFEFVNLQVRLIP